jgi:Asp-tRNA(Asn)/Glu-tRNA(Gln) amidotransferase B subunit
MFRETLRAIQEKERNLAEVSAERVKKGRADFQIRKKNLTDLMTTKSKLNYFSKINEEMHAIKEYQVIIVSFSKWSRWLSKTRNTNRRWREES